MAYLLLLLATLGLFAFSSLPEQPEEPLIPGTAQIQEQLTTAKEWSIETAKTAASSVRTKALAFLRQQLHEIVDESIQ